MLSPKKVKWRKQQKGRMKGKANRGNSIAMGEFGLQATNCGYITNRQIEAARIGMITERLGLSPDQAQRFWPMYNEFSQKRQQIRLLNTINRASILKL